MYIMCYFSILTKHAYEIFQKCISSHTSVACVAGDFCCVSKSKSYSRTKAESRTKKKTMGKGARGEGTFSLCAAESRDLLHIASHAGVFWGARFSSLPTHKFLKVKEASLLA